MECTNSTGTVHIQYIYSRDAVDIPYGNSMKEAGKMPDKPEIEYYVDHPIHP
jgi:hypothetical protein